MDKDTEAALMMYAEQKMGTEGYKYITGVVANCKVLAVDLPNVDMDVLIMAGYLHDISTIEFGMRDHPRKSAEMAGLFLETLKVPVATIKKVQQSILVHSFSAPADQRDNVPLEGQILYDADKMGRLGGLAVVTSLIEFGSKYPNRTFTTDVIAMILKHVEERFIELYQSLYTSVAKQLVSEKFGRTLSFLDGVLEQLSGYTDPNM